jgi:hypothetical protein
VRRILILLGVAGLAAGAWLLVRPRAAHDQTLVGVWQDRRMEEMRLKARDRGPVSGQGSWLVLEAGGAGRQIDYNPVTLRAEVRFAWRTEQADGRLAFIRSFDRGTGDSGAPVEVRYAVDLSEKGDELTLKGAYGGGSQYDRLPALPRRANP